MKLTLDRNGRAGGATGARPPSEHMSDATWMGRGLWLSEAIGREFSLPEPCGSSTGHGLAWRCRVPLPPNKGEAVPPGTSCLRGKMAAPGPCCKELKMEDAAARWSGRVSHPHKGRGPCPSPAAASCDPVVYRPHSHLGLLLSTARRGGGRGSNGVGVCSHLVGGD